MSDPINQIVVAGRVDCGYLLYPHETWLVATPFKKQEH